MSLSLLAQVSPKSIIISQHDLEMNISCWDRLTNLITGLFPRTVTDEDYQQHKTLQKSQREAIHEKMNKSVDAIQDRDTQPVVADEKPSILMRLKNLFSGIIPNGVTNNDYINHHKIWTK